MRYVTDEAYKLQMQEAEQIAGYLTVVFEIAYLCACRGVEVVNLRRSNILEHGLLISRTKGSRDNVILWSPRLKAAVNKALTMHTTLNLHLVLNSHGQPLNKPTLDTAMQRLKVKMDEKGQSYWTLHDLKRKGITDSKDKNIGGHRTEAMRQRYDVGVSEYEPPR